MIQVRFTHDSRTHWHDSKIIIANCFTDTTVEAKNAYIHHNHIDILDV